MLLMMTMMIMIVIRIVIIRVIDSAINTIIIINHISVGSISGISYIHISTCVYITFVYTYIKFVDTCSAYMICVYMCVYAYTHI